MQDILAARIDRLGPDQKDLLQTLAVIGTEFKLGLVRKVELSEDLERAELERDAVSELQLGEFIYEQPASATSSTSSSTRSPMMSPTIRC